MSPTLARTLRTMRVPLLVVATLVAGGTLTWLVHRREAGRFAPPTACSRAIDAVFGSDASTTADSVLLARLLVHRDRCVGDATYVDQARRLMMNLQRLDDARALLDEAERRRASTDDEMAAQRAWIDVEEAHAAEANGDGARATEAQARAVAAVSRLRERWPEWSVPYTILGEMQRTGLAPEQVEDPYALERDARRRIANGAIVRSLTGPQAMVVAFLAGALGILGLAAIVDSLSSIRVMQRLATSSVASAQPGYVKLTGTLELLPKADTVIGPLTKHAGVWYGLETNFGSKGSRTFRERSAQFFVLRDATGDMPIDPGGMTVRTRHSVTRFGSASGIGSSKRTTEQMLHVGDEAYVLGELALVPVGGTTARRVRLPDDGRRLLVSNYSERQLIRRERIWLALGTVLVALCIIGILWGAAQRYGVRAVPGVSA